MSKFYEELDAEIERRVNLPDVDEDHIYLSETVGFTQGALWARSRERGAL